MIGNTTITIRRLDQTATDRYGGPAAGDVDPIEIVVTGAVVAPRSSSDLGGAGRQGVIVGLTLYLPAGSDIVRTDIVDVAGDDYQIDGEVGPWTDPFSGQPVGIEVALKRVAG